MSKTKEPSPLLPVRSNGGLGDDLDMIAFLAQRGELHFDCSQIIFNSDTVNAPEGVTYIFSAWDRRSYHQAILECTLRVRVLESPNE